MTRLTPLLTVLLALCLCGAAAAIEPTAPAAATAATDARSLTLPAPLKLRYTIYGKVGFLPYRAGGFLSWTHDEARYDARMEVEVFFAGLAGADQPGPNFGRRLATAALRRPCERQPHSRV